jgi:hypothetical protein
MKSFAVLTATLLVGVTMTASAEIFRFYGYAFDLESDRYLYTEVHEQEIVDDRWLRGTIRYFDPDGQLIGDKPLDFGANPYVPAFRLNLPGQDYVEGIREVGDRATLFRSRDGKSEEKRLKVSEQMAADSGFHALLRDNFERLMAGENARFKLLVAGNLDAFSFRARKMGETEVAGERAVHLRVEPDSLLRLLVDPLELFYAPDERRLLEYRGISNIRDPRTGDPYMARIVYPRNPPPGAPETLPPLQPEGD